MKKELNLTRNGDPVSYREVDIEGKGIDRSWKNPLTVTYQYEYALYKAATGLFESVECNSRCIESLDLYFRELPHAPENGTNETAVSEPGAKKRKTQEGLLSEMRMMVARDVVGNVTFPMMHECRANVRVYTESDGTHTFVFSDDIYGFAIHMEMPKKGHMRRIRVREPKRQTGTSGR